MAKQSADQVDDWNGQSGERWVANQARLNALVAVFGQAVIEAAAPATGERVLDIGCGAGASSLALAARVGAEGQVLGVDISEPLIDRARALARHDTPALFLVADASSAELPEGAFDILFSRFGVMFSPIRQQRSPTCDARSGRAAGSLSSAGAVRPRTIGCDCRWARSRTSSRRARCPIPKRPDRSRLATGNTWRAS